MYPSPNTAPATPKQLYRCEERQRQIIADVVLVPPRYGNGSTTSAPLTPEYQFRNEHPTDQHVEDILNF